MRIWAGICGMSCRARWGAGGSRWRMRLEPSKDKGPELLMRTRFEPDDTALVAGAVRPEGYGCFEAEIVRQVVLRNRDINPEDGAREFTDWDALAETVTTFLMD